MPGEIIRTTIVSDVDIALEFTTPEGKAHLLVSSRVLSLASLVFARMFKSRFKEGLGNKTTTVGPVTIPLPEDDEAAFKLLCSVLHFRLSDPTHTPDLDLLLSLFISCDKGDFTNAVIPSAELWLQDVNQSTPSANLNKMLLVAFVLDPPHAFRKISWEILVRQFSPFVDLPRLIDHKLAHNSLLCMSRCPLEKHY